MNTAFITESSPFQAWGVVHVSAWVVSILFGVFMVVFAKRFLKEQQQVQLAMSLAFFLILVIAFSTFMKVQLGIFSRGVHLPLALCNAMTLVMPYVIYKRSYRLYEIFYFWILAGTLQALITPDITYDFPHYDFFRYWMVHAGLVVLLLYMTFVFQMRPSMKSFWKSFFWLQAYFVAMIGINYLLGANYGYLNAKPSIPSILDYMPSWPYYLLTCQLLVLPLMFFVYSPFAIKDYLERRNKRKPVR